MGLYLFILPKVYNLELTSYFKFSGILVFHLDFIQGLAHCPPSVHTRTEHNSVVENLFAVTMSDFYFSLGWWRIRADYSVGIMSDSLCSI